MLGSIRMKVLVDSRHHEFARLCEERLGTGECDVPGILKLIMPGPMKRELDGAAETADQIRTAPPFPAIELVVLSRGKGEESEERLRLWGETQMMYTGLSPRSVHAVSEESGHYVHRDDPKAVIEAIRRLTRGGSNSR